MLSQQAMLFPHLSAAANVGFGPALQGPVTIGRRARTARRWLEAVDAADLADRRPAQLSGGQAQRVAVARALAAEPRLLLLDEPMAALDVTAPRRCAGCCASCCAKSGRTAIIVTHDLLDALAIADKVIVVENGRVVEERAVRRVLTAPRSDFAARIAGINLIPGVISAPGVLRTSWAQTSPGSGTSIPEMRRSRCSGPPRWPYTSSRLTPAPQRHCRDDRRTRHPRNDRADQRCRTTRSRHRVGRRYHRHVEQPISTWSPARPSTSW